MYMNRLLHCHFCIQIITDHFLLSKVSHPIHTILGINAHLLYPILCPWKYSIRHKLLYCPVCIFGCFHGNQRCVASCHYFYTWGVLQEVDIIGTVRPQGTNTHRNYKQNLRIFHGPYRYVVKPADFTTPQISCNSIVLNLHSRFLRMLKLTVTLKAHTIKFLIQFIFYLKSTHLGM